MTVKVLGITGSPHRHGNTETLLDSFLEGAGNAGGKVEKVVLSTMQYAPCRGCNVCHKSGDCIVDDDALPLFDQILGADCLAIASPIYSMGITAELKGLIDRSQYIWARKFKLKTLYFSQDHIRQHKGIFIATAGLGWDTVFDGAFPAITAFFNTVGFEYYDNVIANDMDRYGSIRGHPTAMKEAKDRGVTVIRVIEGLKKREDKL